MTVVGFLWVSRESSRFIHSNACAPSGPGVAYMRLQHLIRAHITLLVHEILNFYARTPWKKVLNFFKNLEHSEADKFAREVGHYEVIK